MFAALAVSGCGGGGGSPTSPGGSGGSTYPVTAVIYYDENGNGSLDAGESVRLPGVDVEVAGHVGRSEKLTGRAVVNGVPAGSYAVSVRANSLPPFYAISHRAIDHRAPDGREAMTALTLPIGTNVPDTYLAFGDSITAGEGRTARTGTSTWWSSSSPRTWAAATASSGTDIGHHERLLFPQRLRRQ